MDGLVAPFDLVPFQVDEHVGQAGDGPHEQRGQAAQRPSRPATARRPPRPRRESRRRWPGTAATRPTRADAPRAGSPSGCPLSPRGRGPARPSRSARSGTGPRPRPPAPPGSPGADTTFEFDPRLTNQEEVSMTVAPGEAPQRIEGLVDAPPRLLHGAGRVDRVLRVLDALVDASPPARRAPWSRNAAKAATTPSSSAARACARFGRPCLIRQNASRMTGSRVVPRLPDVPYPPRVKSDAFPSLSATSWPR